MISTYTGFLVRVDKDNVGGKTEGFETQLNTEDEENWMWNQVGQQILHLKMAGKQSCNNVPFPFRSLTGSSINPRP